MHTMGKYFEGGAQRRAAASKKERSTARNEFASKAAQKPAVKPSELPAHIGSVQPHKQKHTAVH